MTLRLVVLLPLCLFAVWWWRQGRARNRLVATIKRMAESGRNEISGQPVEYWLNILNQEATYPIAATDTMVLQYKGQEFFFVDGGIIYIAPGKSACYSLRKVCILGSVGQSGVELLTEQSRVFRFMTGSAELAAFSIFRWSEFVDMLMIEKRQ